jgi:hypothetical protein
MFWGEPPLGEKCRNGGAGDDESDEDRLARETNPPHDKGYIILFHKKTPTLIVP